MDNTALVQQENTCVDQYLVSFYETLLLLGIFSLILMGLSLGDNEEKALLDLHADVLIALCWQLLALFRHPDADVRNGAMQRWSALMSWLRKDVLKEEAIKRVGRRISHVRRSLDKVASSRSVKGNDLELAAAASLAGKMEFSRDNPMAAKDTRKTDAVHDQSIARTEQLLGQTPAKLERDIRDLIKRENRDLKSENRDIKSEIRDLRLSMNRILDQLGAISDQGGPKEVGTAAGGSSRSDASEVFVEPKSGRRYSIDKAGKSFWLA